MLDVLDENLPDLGDTLKAAGFPEYYIQDILRHHEDGMERDHLTQFQRALSLWATYQQDTKQRIIVTLDGRDTAGKGSNIKRVTEQFDLSRHNVTAFSGIPPEEVKRGDNWFKRYEKFFPEEGKVRFYDRSWYNRAGVEAAMGFCSQAEYDWFMQHVNQFEKDRIIDPGYDFLKIYLSITGETQEHRLKLRYEDPRKSWKVSSIDRQAISRRGYYSLAKQRVLELTDTEHAPWIVLDSNEKHLSAVEIIKAIIATSSEVYTIVENELSLDLSPNSEIRRTGAQELERMKALGYIPTDLEFEFRKDS